MNKDKPKEKNYRTTLIDIKGTSNDDLYILANLSPLVDEPESIWSVVCKAIHKPKPYYEVIYKVPEWLTAMERGDNGYLYAVSDEGVIHEFNGNDWKVFDLERGCVLNAIWTTKKNIFSVGNGVALVKDINSAQTKLDKNNYELFGVHGVGDDDVYSVGSSGVISHYDGKEWTLVDSPDPNASFLCVKCISKSEIYIAGGKGVLYCLSDSKWKKLDCPKDITITSIEWYKGNLYAVAGVSIFQSLNVP